MDVLKSRAAFSKLGFWEQWDTLAKAMTEADTHPVKFIFHFVGMTLCFMHIGFTYYLSTEIFPGANLYETFVKNMIAWLSLAYQLGFDVAHHAFAHNWGARVKWKPGTIKISRFGTSASHRRTGFDVLITLAYTASRLWLIASPDPSAPCAIFYCGVTVALFATDWMQFVGSYGYIHLPWAVYVLARYTGQPGALVVLQNMLICMYVGCGIGKMGPWFTQVFNQEWTLPPWAALINLRPLLYNKNFPHDITPSFFGTVLGYAAATTEWAAPVGWFMNAGVLGHAPSTALAGVGAYLNQFSVCAFLGVSGLSVVSSLPTVFATFILCTMHVYIVGHMPAIDVWLLNMVPACILPFAFHFAPGLAQPGFDYAGLAVLPLPFKLWCAGLTLLVLVGQIMAHKVTYVFAFRFWAGNWPQGYLMLRRSAIEKLHTRWPELEKTGPIGEMHPTLEPDEWRRHVFMYGLFGTYQNSQLCHRMVPKLMEPLLKGKSITGFDGTITPSFFGDFWVAGSAMNECHSLTMIWREVSKEVGFEEGECQWIDCRSFPLLAHLYGGRSYYEVHDGKLGLLSSGSFTVDEALAVTRPSLLTGKKLD